MKNNYVTLRTGFSKVLSYQPVKSPETPKLEFLILFLPVNAENLR
jgi:hypothetical protein